MNYFAWQIRPAAPDAEQALAAAGYGVLLRRVLAARGCADAEAARRLLEPEQGLSDPFLLKDMDRAVARIRQAIEAEEPIVIYGDYDVDGICATAILYECLSSQGAHVRCKLPTRGGGYGLTRAALENLAAKGFSLVVVNTGGDHGDLTDDYAAIPAEMKAVAAHFGKQVLREVDPAEMEAGIPQLRGKVSDRAILRALHFYDDNARVPQQVAALREDRLEAFLALVIESGESSWKLLQNVYARPGEEQMALALEMSRRVLQGRGAWRVHGGGFAGTIQAFVPDDLLNAYVSRIEAAFGKGACTVLSIRPEGAVMMPVR